MPESLITHALLLVVVKIYLLFGVRKKLKSAAFGDAILMCFESIKLKKKILPKQNYYLRRLACLRAWLTVLKNHLVFQQSSFSMNWLLAFRIFNITQNVI